MGVGEEVAEPGVREMLFDATPLPAARPIGTLGQPATLRRDPEQATVLLPAHRQLQPDALVAGEERQVAVRGRGSDDLEAAPLLEAAEGGDEIFVDAPEQRPPGAETLPPQFHPRPERPPGPRPRRQPLARGRLHI